MKKASILFFVFFVFCGNCIYGQYSNKKENTNKATIFKDFYIKYEADTNAIITHLPKPKLTPEAIENFVEREIQVQMLLKADGTIDNVTFFGTLRNGMHGRVLASIREIKFKPATFEGKAVSQRVHIKYGIKKCRNQKICTYAFEFTP